MIEIIEGFADCVVAVRTHGHITGADYRDCLIPLMAAKAHHPKLRCYCEIGDDFAGVEPGAMWEDLKLGVEYFSRWERMAVVSDLGWIRISMRLFGPLIPGEARVFHLAEASAAREWIADP